MTEPAARTTPTMPRRLLLPLLALLLALLAAPAAAQSLAPVLRELLRDDNPVVAEVNGTAIRWNDVIYSAQSLPEQYQEQIQVLFPVLLGRLIDLQLIADQARAEDYDERADFQQKLERYESQLLQDLYVADVVAGAVSDEEVEERVEVLTFGVEREEVRISLIVGATQDIARAALRRLNAGTDFATVAFENSVHASAGKGGDIGYYARGEIEPPEVAAEAFSLQVGHYSPVPLKTEVGWVIVKVTDKRVSAPLSRDEVAERIRRELTRLALDKLLNELRAKADISLFPDD